MTGARAESAATRWADELARWAIPEEILATAPESPWSFPPALFSVPARAPAPGDPSVEVAAAALGPDRTVLDVGCGGGAAALALVPPAVAVAGVDESDAMLAGFAAAAAAAGVEAVTVHGRWPDVAGAVAAAEVVVCHHVAYNVAAVVPFVDALSEHATRRVVVELTATHPAAWLAPLWKQFWDLDRPTEPTAELFAEVVREAGYHPGVERRRRAVRKVATADPGYVAFVRRRLCLPASRDREVADAVAALGAMATADAVTVWWDPLA